MEKEDKKEYVDLKEKTVNEIMEIIFNLMESPQTRETCDSRVSLLMDLLLDISICTIMSTLLSFKNTYKIGDKEMEEIKDMFAFRIIQNDL